MHLLFGDTRVCEISALERRTPVTGSGPALMWFEVPLGTELDLAAMYHLVDEDEVASRLLQLLDYEPTRGLVIAIEADTLHVPS